MRLSVLNNIRDVVELQMCCGCGACAYLDPGKFEMVDSLDHGRRPRCREGRAAAGEDREAMQVCPGVELTHPTSATGASGVIRELLPGWGPILEVWEGHAADEEIRFAGSSGGAVSALALACISHQGMHGVLHTKARTDVPYLNHTVLSTTRRQILDATGSRYAPASPCDGLAMIENAPSPCVFIGKPCDVAAVEKTRRLRPALDENIGLTIAIFCAGTPSTRATLRLLECLGNDDPSALVKLRYRGNGWPGETTATYRSPAGFRTDRMSYAKSWGEVLANDKQWRCHVCVDHTGEFADVSVGDPWHRRVGPGEPGRSIVLVRTERGRRIVRKAVNDGHLVLERVDASVLPASQKNLLRGRGAVWGRILGCRLLGAPAPRCRLTPIFRFWWSELTLDEKIRSIVGAMRRVLDRRIGARIVVEPLTTPPPSQDEPFELTPMDPAAPERDTDRLAA